MTVIKLKKVPAKAFNPKRPASTLLLSQIEHLEHAVGREPRRIKRTEGQAARYIAELTAELLRQTETVAAAPAARALVTPTVPAASAGVAPTPALLVGGGAKTAPTKTHALFNEMLRRRVAPKRKSPKKKAARRRS